MRDDRCPYQFPCPEITPDFPFNGDIIYCTGCPAEVSECEMQNCPGLCYDDLNALGQGDGYCCYCPPPPPRKCFPSDSKVYLKNGEQQAMSELQIRDQVQAGINFFFHKIIKHRKSNRTKTFHEFK